MFAVDENFKHMVLEGARENFEVLARPPEGKRFSTGEHELVCSAWDRDKADDCWKDMLERLEQAQVVECPKDCECKE